MRTSLFAILAACGALPDATTQPPVEETDSPVDTDGTQGDTDGTPLDTDTDAPSGFDPSADPAEPFTATLTPAGGLVGHSGVTLDVPAGAVSDEVTITIAPAAEQPEGYDPSTPLYDFEPGGLTFSQPVRVTFQVPDAAADLLVHWSTPVGRWSRLTDSTVDGDRISAWITHFSSGFVSPPGPTTEVFAAPSEEVLDVLFIIDDSPSMIDDQNAIGYAANALLGPILTTDLDWHVGVVTTDTEAATKNGRLQAAGGVTYLDPSVVNVSSVFEDMVNVGGTGAYWERGLLAAQRAIAQPTPALQTHNAGFYRSQGQLVTVFVSDEDDHSAPTLTADDYVTWALGLKASPADLHTMAVVGPTPNGCWGPSNNASAGPAYASVVQQLDGLHVDICDADWSATFEQLLARVRATQCQPLSSPADPATVEVYLHPTMTPLPPEAWRYDADLACVYLSILGNRLVSGGDIGVTYVPL